MPSNLSPREALDRIAALCGDNPKFDDEHWVSVRELRAVLAEVSPEPGDYAVEVGGQRFTEAQWEAVQLYSRGTAPGGVLDRDQARAVLDLWAGGRIQYGEGLLDRLAGCVRPAAIDRDALTDWIKGRDWREWNSPDEVVDGILALVRPVEAAS